MAELRVLFDADALTSWPRTGVGHYAAQLLDALQDPVHGLQMVPYAGGRPISRVPPTPSQPPPQSRLRAAAANLPGARIARAAVNALATRRAVRQLRGDVYHAPNHVLQPVPAPAVLTVHDLSVLRHPEWHPPGRAAYFRRRFAPSVARAAVILTVSDFTRRELVAMLGVPADRVRVTPLAAGPQFRPQRRAEAATVVARHGLQPGYLLAVGTREPRKNLGRLLDAWEGLRDRPQLVLVGPPGWRTEALEARLDRLGSSVRRLGYVDDADRPALYAGAAAFAYPSLYEGFGLPPLEAAACGVPVLTSLGTPMAEVLGDAAVLVDATDTNAIREGLRRLLAGGGDREAGLAAAAALSWPDCAARTAEAYRAAARA